MKILVVCQYYYPESFQITPICEQLSNNGHEVTVLTGLPNYPTGIVPEEYKTGHRDEIINGVHVIRCYEIGRKKGVANLAVNYLSFIFSASRSISKLANNFDLLFVYQLSPVFMSIPGILFARKHNVPLYLYCCDLWPESMKLYIKNESNPLFQIVKFISKRIYQAADRIACQSSSFLSYLQKTHNIQKKKLIYVPAFADESYLLQDFTPEDSVVDFVFLGNLGIAQNLISVLKAVERISGIKGFKVHFVGDGTCLDEMQTFVKEHQLNDIVFFYGRRPIEEMPMFYKLADACLVSLTADNQIGLSLPAKVQGYMAAGKPIIGMIDGSTKYVIDESGCGICVRPDDIEGLAMAMKDFIEHKERYKECGERGRDYFKVNFSKAKFIETLEYEFSLLVRELL